ncbi:ABC transporter ATP-binding protein [Simiduia sp. 21SJ11W-1]|uniref:ABC transporter ATP-binding protein n=1 Tax=Simiduia sp. 21SJ11W-1 TaxID=2909669 RepID=UPI00209DDA2E|nr:ABC transporter ATP-binding protein [Simiduia sp. 21SJ11W-1]UTA48380.1 ABC transporter ATP-binding protein [Simiduia sp. 21SJ11W-1]
MPDTILRAQNLSKHYGQHAVLNDVSFAITQGEFVALMGPSGHGKSTLLNICGLLDRPCTGELFIAEANAAGIDARTMASVRQQHLGYVFQDFCLVDDATVLENVLLPTQQRPANAAPEVLARAQTLLEQVGMKGFEQHLPHQLSGGQKQRAAIARALINQPTLILADEPTGSLDSENTRAVLEIFEQLHADGATILMVTHDQSVASRASRTLQVCDGRVA